VPRRTREGADWPDDLQRTVVERAARHAWLDAYRVGEDGP
jgi:hypothetical protein